MFLLVHLPERYNEDHDIILPKNCIFGHFLPGIAGSFAELQKRADRADQSVLFFLASANFWEKHAKNCAIMSMAHITYAIAH